KPLMDCTSSAMRSASATVGLRNHASQNPTGMPTFNKGFSEVMGDAMPATNTVGSFAPASNVSSEAKITFGRTHAVIRDCKESWPCCINPHTKARSTATGMAHLSAFTHLEGGLSVVSEAR